MLQHNFHQLLYLSVIQCKVLIGSDQANVISTLSHFMGPCVLIMYASNNAIYFLLSIHTLQNLTVYILPIACFKYISQK